jgi:sugar diacid utilization regulator
MASPDGAPGGAAALRDLHLGMIAAVIDGGGLERLAGLARAELDRPVAIVVPRVGEGMAPSAAASDEDVARLRECVRARIAGRPSALPGVVAAEAAVSTGDEIVGTVFMLTGRDPPQAEVAQILEVTAMAVLTELAVAAAREGADEATRSSLIELIRTEESLPDEDLLRRAHRLGADLSRGAIALCAELTSQRPRHVIAVIRDLEPQALAEHLDDRVYALLPAGPGADPAPALLETGRRIAKALASHAIVGFSSFCLRPGLFHRAITEAELVIEVLRYEAGESGDDLQSVTYRLLINTMATRPDEVMHFYEDTVAPLVEYDRQYNTDLVSTLEGYFRHNCNMNATASAIYAHRHTIAYRLDRVRELTGLDPGVSEDRERLGLGLKVYRILAPKLHR